MKADFDRVAARAAALRLTEIELIERVKGVSYPSYWRARKGRVGLAAQVKTLRQVEAELDRIEQSKVSEGQ